MVQLHQRLADRGIVEEVGGVEYLSRLAESVLTARQAPSPGAQSAAVDGHAAPEPDGAELTRYIWAED